MKRIANESNGVLKVETEIKTNIRVLYCQVCYRNVKCDTVTRGSALEYWSTYGETK